jgi:hypothetical protein
MLKFLLKETINALKCSSRLLWVTWTLETWALVQDTKFNIENILDLTRNWTLEWYNTLKEIFCSWIKEIINCSNLPENYDISCKTLDIEQFKNDLLQLQENIWSNLELDPDKLENLLTILVSMWTVSFVFIYLIPKILQKIKLKK